MAVYLDYNASSPVRPEVGELVRRLLLEDNTAGVFANPSSVHWAGQACRRLLESARQSVATQLSCRASDILFTSGGSESDSLALRGVLRHPTVKTPRLVMSAVEHPAVRDTAHRLRAEGVSVEEIPVSPEGRLDLDALEQALRTPTTLVSVLAVNNETGIISPIEEVIALARNHGCLVHVDAVQAVGRVALPLEADLLTLTAHKFGGIKGAGILRVRECVPLRSEIAGGPQERGRRAGTENLLAILGLEKALSVTFAKAEEERPRIERLVRRLERVIGQIDGAYCVGSTGPRVTNTTTWVFEGIDGDAALQALDLEGFATSSGSACSSGSLEPSHVLTAMQIPAERALSAIRFSLGWASQEADIDQLEEVLAPTIARVRAASA
jgi:cysteine desulfurase